MCLSKKWIVKNTGKKIVHGRYRTCMPASVVLTCRYYCCYLGSRRYLRNRQSFPPELPIALYNLLFLSMSDPITKWPVRFNTQRSDKKKKVHHTSTTVVTFSGTVHVPRGVLMLERQATRLSLQHIVGPEMIAACSIRGELCH
jgi:hypothetical protein